MKKNRACSTKGRENIRDRLFFRDALLLHANACDGVAVENLDMRAMALRSMLAYKLLEQGKQMVVIDKWYPSGKRCHKCGNEYKK